MQPPLLIIDDDASVREALTLVLELRGYHVASVPDAETGLEWLTTTRPALVILDCRLPGMDGLTAAGKIRADWPSLPILGVSAHLERSGEMLRNGATEFLPKPLDMKTFLLRVEALLETSADDVAAREA